jgi:hypothetical protein
MLDIIDASGFLHVGSALSSTFPLAFPGDRIPYTHARSFVLPSTDWLSLLLSEALLR